MVKVYYSSGIMLTGMLTGIGFWKRERLGNILKKMQPDNKKQVESFHKKGG